jgi:hypothetical protein
VSRSVFSAIDSVGIRSRPENVAMNGVEVPKRTSADIAAMLEILRAMKEEF